jgi:multidrug efflux pump subunit AcrA (membrane-fusion protein)
LGTRALLTVPLVDQAECYGAVLFERHSENPFTQQDFATAEALANLVGSALEEKRQASLPLYSYVKRALELQLTRLLGTGFLWRKVAVAIVLALLLFFSFAKGDYNLSADAVLEGEEVRALVSSFDSYIESANYRAGDKVAQGDVLAVLDTRELRLQRISWQSQLAQSQRQYEEALAKQERAQVQINTAQIERARAELQLIDFQIGQAKLEAPFDALVINGDLSQRIGGVVKQGDVLFELSPRERFRLALYVDEFRINDVKPGQSGRLVLAALSEQEFPFQVTRINPMAEVRDGKTLYRVEADLLNQEDILRAGLEGVAQIGIDQRLLISIWTRGLRDWLRLEWWRFWG